MLQDSLQEIQILIIEDDPITADSMQLMLREFGFTIKGIVHTLEAALRFLNKETFDIALVDIDLNGSNSGIEIGTMIHSLYRLPFIFITGLSDKAIIAEAIKANPAAYLVKPSNAATLFACIQTAIQNFSNKQVGSLQQHQQTGFFFIKTRNKLKRVEWKDVVLLSSADNYTVFTFQDKSEHYIRSSLAMTLKYQVPKHLQENFLQVNRSEAVQLAFISEIEEDEMVTTLKKVSITKAYLKDVKERLNIL